MTVVLAISPDQTGEPLLRARLAAAGFANIAWAPCDAVVQKVAESAPLLVVAAAFGSAREHRELLSQALAQALQGWQPAAPCALVLWLPEADGAGDMPVAALLEAGLHACLVGELGPQRLQEELHWAQARWQREAALLLTLARTQGQLDDRKWVERAKGVLMAARHIGEDQAFALLRGASMHANLRLGEVSRAVIQASQWAEAVNRAGQLRMLSQRVVKLAAQRAAGIEPRRSRTLQQLALARVQENLDHLAALPWNAVSADEAQPVGGALALVEGLASTHSRWQTLSAALADKASSLEQIDHHAEALLVAAEALTTALETAAGRRALRIVNLCGRQRMRVQRAAKEALLAALLQQPCRQADLKPTLDAFEAALLELECAPLSSPEIRTGLLAAREEWARLLRSLGSIEQAEGRALLARSSEALLDIFDRLTAAYEHSLQVIMS